MRMRWANTATSGVSRYRDAGHLRHGVMSYLGVVAVVALIDAWTIWANHNLLFRPAYSWAGNLAPWWLWLIGWASVAIGAVTALILDRRKRCPVWLVASTLGVHGAMCAVVGASLASGFLNGSESFAGAGSKWLTFTAAAIWMSRQATLFEQGAE